MTTVTDTATVSREAETLRRLIAEAGTIVAFTGAGISTESGVPDFRSPGSPWLVNPPIEYGVFMRSADARREAWRRKFTMDDVYRGAKPSRGHIALARLVAEGRCPGIITQNIDALHQAAGVPDAQVVELHGNGTYATCLDCGLRHEIADVRRGFEADGQAPACRACGGIVKSATVSFGQAMPESAMQRAAELARAADLFLAIGSSLVVYPAAGFPVLAQRSGATLVVVNRDPTGLDEVADVVLRGEIGALFAPLAATH